MSKETAYIIGSGPSLLDLSKEEVAHLNDSPRTLSLNLYLQHWEKVGVMPKCHMMADGHFPCIKFFVEEIRRIRKLGNKIKYYVSNKYFHYFPKPTDLRGVKHAIRKRWTVWREFSYFVPLYEDFSQVTPFSQVSEGRHQHRVDEDGWFWAETLDDPLYFSRGTLSSAINLASILWPDCDIKLLGIDLNSYGYFFDPKRGEEDASDLHAFNEKRLHPSAARHHKKSHEMNTHATAVTFDLDSGKKLPGIQAAFPRMMEELGRTGRKLYCVNPESLLVTDGVCPHAPVISTAAQPA